MYIHLLTEARELPGGPGATNLEALRRFADFDAPLPDTLDDEFLASLQAALFRTRSRLAVLMCSDLLGIPLRFNLPGSYGRGTWSDRLEMPLHELSRHPVYGPRVALAADLIRSTGRI